MMNKDHLNVLQAELRKAKSKKTAERTTADNLKIAELECAVADAKTQIKKAKLNDLKRKIERAKQQSFLKILAANNVSTEQELKNLFTARNILREAGITNLDELRNHFAENVKNQNS